MTDLLTRLCSVPTAPYAEHRVIASVEAFVRQRPRLSLRRDRFGNLLIAPRSASRQPRWVFAAHMDHPGLVATRMLDPRTLAAEFHGGVLREYVAGAKVRFFTEETVERTPGNPSTRAAWPLQRPWSVGHSEVPNVDEITGVVRTVERSAERPELAGAATITVRRPVPPGTPGMFDVGGGRVRGKRFVSRVCDNLAGAAAALAMLDDLHRKPPAAPVAVLLTRAEEVGFVGAIAAVKDGALLRKSDRLIVIECSAAQSYAPQGRGVVIRVGDRTSVFNSSLSHFLTQQAIALGKVDPSFQYQRALMPGGTCEATVYDVYGYTAGSICVPLGNYHNMDRAARRIAAEHVNLDDWRNMVALFVRVARHAHTYRPGHAVLRASIEARFAPKRARLVRSAGIA